MFFRFSTLKCLKNESCILIFVFQTKSSSLFECWSEKLFRFSPEKNICHTPRTYSHISQAFQKKRKFQSQTTLGFTQSTNSIKKKHFSLKRKIAFYGQVFCTDVTKRFWGFQISLDFGSQLEWRASYETMRVFVSKGRSSPAQVFYTRVLVKRNNRTHAFFRAYRMMLKSGIFTQTFSKGTNERGYGLPRRELGTRSSFALTWSQRAFGWPMWFTNFFSFVGKSSQAILVTKTLSGWQMKVVKHDQRFGSRVVKGFVRRCLS